MPQAATKNSPLKFSLPPQPELLLALQNEVRKKDINIATVGKIISGDVAISAAVLKTINSSFFSMKVKVSSIQHAVSLMGIEPTINIVTGFALEQSTKKETANLPRYWDSAKNTANLCAFLAKKLNLHEPSQPYTLGLFHDIGIPLMASRFPDYLNTLKIANDSNEGLVTDVEDKTYHTNHAVMGYFLCREWGLPDSIRNVIQQHHDFVSMMEHPDSTDEKVPNMMAILKLAEWGNEVFRTGESGNEWQHFGHIILDYLGISEDDSLDLLEDMKEALLDAR